MTTKPLARSIEHSSPANAEEATALLGLGANLGDRAATLHAAVAALQQTPGIIISAVSTFIETDPVGVTDQPRFLNGAVKIQTVLTPRQLLNKCLEIERIHGRDRASTGRWGARTLDIDLLLYGHHMIDEPGLHVPHPRLHERLFALQPAVEIAPEMLHTVTNRSIRTLFDDLQRNP